MIPEDMQTKADCWEYCTLYSASIYVRAELKGKRGAYSLEELPPAERVACIKRLIESGVVPTRLPSDDEIAGKAEDVKDHNHVICEGYGECGNEICDHAVVHKHTARCRYRCDKSRSALCRTVELEADAAEK